MDGFTMETAPVVGLPGSNVDAFNYQAVGWDPFYVPPETLDSLQIPVNNAPQTCIPQAAMPHTQYEHPYEDEEEAKKKKRRETQAKYYQRRKAKIAEEQQGLAEVRAQRDEARKQCEQLRIQSDALENLQSYKHTLITWTKSVLNLPPQSEALQDAPSGSSSHSHLTDTSTTTEQELDIPISEFVLIENEIQERLSNPIVDILTASGRTDLQMRFFIRRVRFEQLMIHRERGFLAQRDLLTQWKNSTSDSERAKIARKLDRFMDVRMRIVNIMKVERPDLLDRFFCGTLVPPGADDDPVPGVNPVLYPLLAELQLTPKQEAKLKIAWNNYKANVSAARQECKRAHQNVTSMESVTAPASLGTSSIAKISKAYLDLFEGAALLTGHSKREAEFATQIFSALYDTIDSVQQAMCISRSYPFFIDPVQLLELMLGGHDGTPGIIEATRNAPVVDKCHFIAESHLFS